LKCVADFLNDPVKRSTLFDALPDECTGLVGTEHSAFAGVQDNDPIVVS
jgi:hypothetical protein